MCIVNGRRYSTCACDMATSYASQPTPVGWQCPVCGSIWAPFVEECSNCNTIKGIYGNSGTTTVKASTVWPYLIWDNREDF